MVHGGAIGGGRFEAASALFRHARVESGGYMEFDLIGLLALWRRLLTLYLCGTPRTRRLIANPIDVSAGTAQVRSCYTVLQATEDFPLQVVASVRYHDRFARIDGNWRFCASDYRHLDFTGDLGQHLRVPVRRWTRAQAKNRLGRFVARTSSPPATVDRAY